MLKRLIILFILAYAFVSCAKPFSTFSVSPVSIDLNEEDGNEKNLTLHFESGNDYPGESVRALLSNHSSWLTLEKSDINVQSSTNVRLFFNRGILSDNTYRDTIMVRADNGQIVYIPVSIQTKSKLQVSPDSLAFEVNDNSLSLSISSLEGQSKLKVSASDKWVSVDTPEVVVSPSSPATVNVVVDRTKLLSEGGIYYSSLSISDTKDIEVKKIPLSVVVPKYDGTDATMSCFYLMIEDCIPEGNDVNVALSVKNTGSTSAGLTLFRYYEYDSNIYSYAVDNRGESYECEFSPKYYSDYSADFSPYEEKKVIVKIKNCNNPNSSIIKYLSLQTNYGNVGFENVSIRNRGGEEYSWEPVTESHLLSEPDGFTFKILRTYYDNSALNIDYCFESAQSTDILISFDSEKFNKAIYDNNCKYFNISRITIGLGETRSYSHQDAVIHPYVKYKGRIVSDGIPDSEAIQSLSVAVLLDGTPYTICFSDLEIEGKTPVMYDWTIHEEADVEGLKVYTAECKDHSNSTSLLVKFENTASDNKQLHYNKQGAAYDNWGSIGKEYNSFSHTIYPKGYAYTFLSFPPANEHADIYSLINLPASVNGKNVTISIRDIPILNRTHHDLPIIQSHKGLLDCSIIRCYESQGETMIDFILENALEKKSVIVGADASRNIFTDNNLIDYSSTSFMLDGSKVTTTSTIEIPNGVKVRGSIALPLLEDISSHYASATICYNINDAEEDFSIGRVDIEGRDVEAKAYNPFAIVDNYEFSLIDCTENNGRVVIDYLLKNTGQSDSHIQLATSYMQAYDDWGNVYQFANVVINHSSSTNYYPSTSIRSGKVVRGQFYISDFSPNASVIKLLKLAFNRTNNSKTANLYCNITVKGREPHDLPTSRVSYETVFHPKNVLMELISIENAGGSAVVDFRLTNNNSIPFEVIIDLYSSSFGSYAIDSDDDKHLIKEIRIGNTVMNNTYVFLTIPANIMVNGSFTIPNIPESVRSLKSIALLYSNEQNYLFKNINW